MRRHGRMTNFPDIEVVIMLMYCLHLHEGDKVDLFTFV